MEFTDLFQGTGPAVWSPDGSLLAIVDGSRLTIRDTSTLLVVNFFTCVDALNRIEWSCDGRYLLCAMYKRGLVQVWDVEDPQWLCKITEGPAGLSYSRWSPDGRTVLDTNDFNVRITVWSLCSKAGVVASLRSPKFADRAVDFSSDGKFLAVAERRDCKDFVQIYECSTWSAVSRFPVETKDLADLKWSPDDRAIGADPARPCLRVAVRTPKRAAVRRARRSIRRPVGGCVRRGSRRAAPRKKRWAPHRRAAAGVWDSALDYLFLAYSPEGRRVGRYQVRRRVEIRAP